MSNVLQPMEQRQRYVPKNIKHEESVQRQLCTYLRLQWPHIIFRSDYGSGVHLTHNQARIQRSMQSGKSFPDITIYHPSRGYHGMMLELKREGTIIVLKTGPRKGKISSNPHIQEQAAVINDLNGLGYYADFGVGLDDSIKKVDWYLKRPLNTELF